MTDKIGEMFLYQLPLDYFRTLPPKVDAVTAQDVERVANKYLAPDSMVVIAVGDREKIAAKLSELKLGPTTAFEVNGKPIPESNAATTGK